MYSRLILDNNRLEMDNCKLLILENVILDKYNNTKDPFYLALLSILKN